jgi:hypothetical protein
MAIVVNCRRLEAETIKSFWQKHLARSIGQKVSRSGCFAAALLAFLWGTHSFAYDQHRPPGSLDRDLRPIEYAPPCTLREVGRPPAAKRSHSDDGETCSTGHDATPVAASNAAVANPDSTLEPSTRAPIAAAAPSGRAFDARGPPLRA